MIYTLDINRSVDLQSIYDSAMNELNQFFDINWVTNKPRMIVVNDRETIDSLRNMKTENWVIGWCEDRDVYILNRDSMEKESCHKIYTDEQYAKLVKHEFSHAFTNATAKARNIKPKWLWEGVAIYTSGQNSDKNKPEKFRSFLEFFDQGGLDIYTEAGFAIELLVENFGKDKVLNLIKHASEFKTREIFDTFFRQQFGFGTNYDDFNKLLIHQNK